MFPRTRNVHQLHGSEWKRCLQHPQDTVMPLSQMPLEILLKVPPCELATQNKSQEKPRGNTKYLKVLIRDGDMLKQETKTSKRQTCIRTAQAHTKTKVTKMNKI